MGSLAVTVSRSLVPQPVPILPPGPLKITAHDYQCDDPRHGQTEGFVSRTNNQKDTIPEAFQTRFPEAIDMDLEAATLLYESMRLYQPAYMDTSPPYFPPGEDWTWLTDKYMPENMREQWYLHFIKSDRYTTNFTGPDVAPYYDPITGYGSGTKPYKMALIMAGGNMIWVNGKDGAYWNFWCIDGLFRPLPTAAQIKDMFFLLNICTQATPNRLSTTPRPDAPNGPWIGDYFPHADGNIVVKPLISVWPDGRTMVWNGIHLRENQLTDIRVLDWPPAYPWAIEPKTPFIRTW